jgi:phosphate transport system protein
MAIKALIERDDELADTVEMEDSQVDQLEVTVDEMVITYMATHAPVATDCRFMLVASKISSDLERIADQATTIARRARDLNKEPLLNPMVEIPCMAKVAQEMLRAAITAFVEEKIELVEQVIHRDKELDEMNHSMAHGLEESMIRSPDTARRCLNLLLIGRAIERVGDHAKNIAEDIFYLYRAQDIRHERSVVVS